MKRNRREFLKLAGVTAASASVMSVTSGLITAEASGAGVAKPTTILKKNKKALTAKRWGMVIDTRKLETESDIEHIVSACHKIHNVPKMENKNHEIKWVWEDEFKHVFAEQEHELVNERLRHLPFLVLCNHCKNPSCVKACPTNATFQTKEGLVMMDFHRCIGCRFCMAACPYGSRSFNFQDPRPFIKETNKEFPTRMKGVVEKCNFCAERLAVGKQPACVEASKGAIIFGDLDDPQSEIREVLNTNYTIRRKPALGTGPSIYYIV
ncbi:MAG: 4Fe-4S dicluster domain-containing protein [Deltaproteobacteria bacterium]|nr:4Fe-4S dicluster domain-containing protein [Deltaproteobacteria bacterium]